MVLDERSIRRSQRAMEQSCAPLSAASQEVLRVTALEGMVASSLLLACWQSTVDNSTVDNGAVDTRCKRPPVWETRRYRLPRDLHRVLG